jgi:putative phage-type endonuclease
MKTLQLVQGTPEWFAHRATHFNASDAPAMLGISPYKTRKQLLDERASGITAEVDEATQRRFDDGHRFEALARPLAETIIGEELYPCVGISDDGRYSASFDGLTLLEDTAFEHKSLNDDLWAIAVGGALDMAMLPEHYRVQMEQQCMVSGATGVLFMASRWNGHELVDEVHGWYTPDPELRARIIAGWEQFERDLADYQPAPDAAPKPVGSAPETLPALRVEAQGMVTFSNLAEFRENAMAVLGAINRDLQTDEDFADAETTVKWCKGVEDRLDAAKANVLAQMQSVDEVCRTIDNVSAETRKVRLELDRLVKAEKEHRRAEIVAGGVAAVREHYVAINATLGAHALGIPASLASDIGASIKGRKTLTSIRDAVDTAVAAAKIEASQQAERTRQNIAVLADFAEHAHLFADSVQLCATKAPEDLRNLCATRVAEHQQREAERLEAERARIRAEEQAKAERAERLRQQAIAETERARQEEAARIEREQQAQPIPEVATPAAVATAHSEQAPTAAVRSGAKIKLGDINARIAPLSISADGLSQLGFEPVEHQRSAKLYAAADLPAILRAMVDVLQGRPPLRKTA